MSKSTGNEIKFTSNQDGGEYGDKPGTPNSYRVDVDGVEVGIVIKHSTQNEWGFYRFDRDTFDGVEFDYAEHASAMAVKLDDVKKQVRCLASALKTQTLAMHRGFTVA